MTVACLLVPSLALTCALAERPQLVGQSVALADVSRTRVVDCTAEAGRYGVRSGLPLREAVALCPGLAVLDERPARTARAADSLIDALGTVSPLLEEAGPGVVYADLRGLDGLYPRPGMIARAVLAAAPVELGPRMAIADTKFTAYVAARCLSPGDSTRITSTTAADFLASKPAAWLPLDREGVERLRLFGIETVGAFAALPVHAIEAQFGTPGRSAWLAAQGMDPSPLRPRPFARERVLEQMRSDPPLVSREVVMLNVEQLLRRALRHPRAVRRFVRSIRLRATTEDDQLWERTRVLREPTGDRKRLWVAIRSLLEYAEFPGLISALELELGGLTAESGRQSSLLDTERVRRHEQLDEMVRHLKVRYGLSPMARMVEVEPWSRIPERRWGLMDYDP